MKSRKLRNGGENNKSPLRRPALDPALDAQLHCLAVSLPREPLLGIPAHILQMGYIAEFGSMAPGHQCPPVWNTLEVAWPAIRLLPSAQDKRILAQLVQAEIEERASGAVLVEKSCKAPFCRFSLFENIHACHKWRHRMLPSRQLRPKAPLKRLAAKKCTYQPGEIGASREARLDAARRRIEAAFREKQAQHQVAAPAPAQEAATCQGRPGTNPLSIPTA